jgi:hypothetical protein
MPSANQSPQTPHIPANVPQTDEPVHFNMDPWLLMLMMSCPAPHHSPAIFLYIQSTATIPAKMPTASRKFGIGSL